MFVSKNDILQVVLSSSSKYFKDLFRHQPGVTLVDLDKELAPNDLNLTLEDVQLIIGILYCVGTVEISPQRIETLLVCSQVLGWQINRDIILNKQIEQEPSFDWKLSFPTKVDLVGLKPVINQANRSCSYSHLL